MNIFVDDDGFEEVSYDILDDVLEFLDVFVFI